MATDKDAGKGQTVPRQLAGAAAPTPPALDIPTLGTKSPEPAQEQSALPGAEAAIPISAVEAMMARQAEAQMQMMAKMLANAEERWARNRPASITESFDAFSTTPDKRLDIPVDGALDDMLRPDLDLVRADPITFKDHAEELAFLEEDMIVNFSESTDPNDQPVFSLSVNGKPAWITRGQNTRLKRYYVEKAFRSKPEKVKVNVGKDGEGNVVNRVTKSSALAFPFQILHHGKSQERSKQWAQKLMREG